MKRKISDIKLTCVIILWSLVRLIPHWSNFPTIKINFVTFYSLKVVEMLLMLKNNQVLNIIYILKSSKRKF